MLKRVQAPFLAIGRFAHRHATDHLERHLYGEPIYQHIKIHEENGVDLCHEVNKEAFQLFFAYLPYRKEKLKQEISDITAGHLSLHNMDLKTLVFMLRFVLRCVITYMVMLMLSRRSLLPLLDPESPFVVQLAWEYPDQYFQTPQ